MPEDKTQTPGRSVQTDKPTSQDKQHIFDNPAHVQRLLQAFVVSLLVLFFLDAVVENHHPYFPWESKFGFYSVYGFIACVVISLGARYILRPLVMRKEGFYDDK